MAGGLPGCWLHYKERVAEEPWPAGEEGAVLGLQRLRSWGNISIEKSYRELEKCEEFRGPCLDSCLVWTQSHVQSVER